MTEQTIIDRMVAAMKAVIEERAPIHGNFHSDGMLHGEVNFDGTLELDKLALAAVEAMRDPTERMFKAGFMGSTVEWLESSPRDVWENMIDELLAEDAEQNPDKIVPPLSGIDKSGTKTSEKSSKNND